LVRPRGEAEPSERAGVATVRTASVSTAAGPIRARAVGRRQAALPFVGA
jgi:hypothetical protein